MTLRAAGPYRYYLATSIGAGAPPRLLADAELLGASFRPNVEVKREVTPTDPLPSGTRGRASTLRSICSG